MATQVNQNTPNNIQNVSTQSGSPNMETFLNDVFGALGLNQQQGNTIIDELRTTFNTNQLQMIVTNAQLRQLVDADRQITNLQTNGQFASFIGTNEGMWNSFKQNLGKLQVLAILKKIRQGNCDATIQTIVDALNTKIQAVNTILETNLQSGGGKQSTNSTNDPYYHKFLKYKFKYMLAKYENKFQ